MFFLSKDKATQKPGKKTYKSRFGPVYVDDRTKTISFREKKWRFEITKSQILRFFGKGAYRSAIAGVLIVSVLSISLSMPSEAKVAEFYAGSCLGGWQNTAQAQGEPNVVQDSGVWFSSENAAMNTGSETDIFCGGFVGDVPEGTNVSSAELSFSIYVGDTETDADGVIKALGAPTETTPLKTEPKEKPNEKTQPDPAAQAGGGSASTTQSATSTATSSVSDNTSASESTTASSGDAVVIEGSDFESQAGAILDADSDNVSFTLMEEDETNDVTVVSTSGDFATTASAILDAPAGSDVSVTDSTPATTTINGNLIDNFYDILDAPDGASVQMSFPDDEGTTSNEQPQEAAVQEEAQQPVEEEQQSPAEEGGSEPVEPAQETSEPTAFLNTLLRNIFGAARVVFATTSVSEQGEISSDETSAPEEETSQTPDSQEPEAQVAEEDTTTTTQNDTATTSGDENVDGDVVQQENEETNNPTEQQDIATGTDEQTAASTTDSTATSSTATSSDSEVQQQDETYSPGHVLTVEYTFNGIDWLPVGEVTLENWEYVSFDLPIVDWNEVENVQVRLTRDNVQEVQTTVMLDAVSLSISYDNKNKPELVGGGNGKAFKATDNLVFNFKYKEAKESGIGGAANQAATLIGLQKNFDRDFLVSRATLISKTGKRTDVDSQIILGDNDEWQVVVTPNTRSMKPGKYIIEVEVEDNGESTIQQQEFYWGVLTINTNKSIYQKNEQAYLQMGVLDDLGRTICDANLELTIENPNSSIEILTTASGTIAYSTVCAGDTYVEEPDYSAYYMTGDIGEYTMNLKNLDNGFEIDDTFEVRGYVPFVVEREGPTRIYPPATYEVRITIEARQKFSGDIYEYMPDTFAVEDISQTLTRNGSVVVKEVESTVSFATSTSATSSIQETESQDGEVVSFGHITYEGTRTTKEEQGTKELMWTAEMETGDIATIVYTFDAPDISPEIFLLGPLEFYE